ncbi:MAG: hypothetical protein L6R37_005228 [Teloschistes peruensis]|nr:MAG: hypothetical protein L6R37_005228 [Teloschistes peruensis]
MGSPMAQAEQTIGFAPLHTMDESEHGQLRVPDERSVSETHHEDPDLSVKNGTKVKSEDKSDFPVTNSVTGKAVESFGAIDSALGESLSKGDHREPQHAALTPVAQVAVPRRKGRPPGSKNKKPLEKPVAHRGSQAPSMSERKSHGDELVPTNLAPLDSTQRQLFKGQRAMRSRPGFGLPGLTQKSSASAVRTGRCGRRITQDKSHDPLFKELASCCDGVPALIKTFKGLVYPVLVTLKNAHQNALPDEALMAICMQVSPFLWTLILMVRSTDRDTKLATETFDDKLKAFLKESNYHMTEEQKLLVENWILRHFAQKFERASEEAAHDSDIRGPPAQLTSSRIAFNGTKERRLHEIDQTSRYGQHKGRKKLSIRVNEIPHEASDWSKLLYPPQSTSSTKLAIGKSADKPSTRLNRGAAPAAAKVRDSDGDRPYKSSRRGHCDFDRDECLWLLHTLDDLDQKPYKTYSGDIIEVRKQLKTRMVGAAQDKVKSIIQAARDRPEFVSMRRKKKSVRAFLADLINKENPPEASTRLALPMSRKIGLLLGSRELGLTPWQKTGFRDPQEALHLEITQNIQPWRSWKGASGDVVTVAWGPNSNFYAAGAAAQSDNDDLQYNRPCNLLFGGLTSNIITEIPDHRIARPMPDTITSGPNSSYAVYQACDPVVYKTVTSVQFSPWGGYMYTGSHDGTAKIWDVSLTPGRPCCISTLSHDAEVTSLELSTHYPGYFATAAKTVNNAIRVFSPAHEPTALSSSQAVKHCHQDIYPECVRWGLTSNTKHLLLAGFQKWAAEDFSAARCGQICLWDVNTAMEIRVRPHISSIFSAAWHPREDIFATGGAPGSGPLSYPNETQSVVRSYDVRNTSNYIVEFECPALDMQDVTFHPLRAHYVSAACTDGTTYVWDYRRPDLILHRLGHGRPLQELPPNEEELSSDRHREKVDAGVMLSLWDAAGSMFYTGSSDGVVKAWDILRSPQDVWVRDITHLPAGVQSGALSPDGTNMLVGDAVGGIHILSAAPISRSANDGQRGGDDDESNIEPIGFIGATVDQNNDGEDPDTEGIEASRELLQTGQLLFHPTFGIGKGPNYQGPFAVCARWNNRASGFYELLPDLAKQQAFSLSGDEQLEHSSKIKALISARCEQMQAIKDGTQAPTFSFGPPTSFVANRRSSIITAGKESRPGSRSAAIRKGLEDTLESTPMVSQPGTGRSSATVNPNATPNKRVTYIDLDEYILRSSPRMNQKRKRKPSMNSDSSLPPTKRTIIASPNGAIPPRVLANQNLDVVDLTGDDDVPSVPPVKASVSGKTVPVAPELQTRRPMPYAMIKEEHSSTSDKMIPIVDLDESDGKKKGVGSGVKGRVKEEKNKKNLLSWTEWVDEDFWWPEGC